MGLGLSSHSHGWRAKKRVRLFAEQNGLCYYCRCKMVLNNATHGGKFPDNMATFEHLRDRLDPRRRRPNPSGEQRIVLACSRCNQERGRQRVAALGLDEQRRRSGHAHAAGR